MGRGQEPTVIADRALNNAKRLTTIQYVAMLCSIVIFSLGSQIFYLIPFYMYYPALICHTPEGSFECDHHRACDVDITSYDLNWDSHDTLSNWMTQLDFICMEPFYIGILGSISFISFSIGSFFFTKQADVYGRHLVTCTAATVTPLALVILIFGVPHFGLIGIYITFAVLGLTYNPRGSTAYLYGAEMLPTNKRLLFGQVLFFADGIFSICASFYFYSVGNLNAFFAGVLVAFTTALVAMTFLLPETPSFLLMKGDIVEYQRIVALVTG
jgi:MFS family permease